MGEMPFEGVPDNIRRRMSGIRKIDTHPEMIVRRMLHRLGFRFRLHRRNLPGTPDVVFPRLRKIIFVNGCFWHQHDCQLGRPPKSRLEYWLPKLARNTARDETCRNQLLKQGWGVLTIWECETKKLDALERKLCHFLASSNL